MPSNWLYIDTNFPSFTQKESDGEKIETMQDYLFMLVEQLRYTLRNLDLKNMNKAAMYGFLQNIREPIYAKIEDTNKNVNELSITAQGLSERISSAEGNITQLGATADGVAGEHFEPEQQRDKPDGGRERHPRDGEHQDRRDASAEHL